MPHLVVAGKLHPSGLALLEAADVTFDYVPDADPQAYLAHLPRAEGLVLRTQPLTRTDVARAPHLQIVSRHGVGYDAVDVAALDARGIPLAIVGDVNSRTVAEHAMMLTVAVSRRLVPSFDGLREGDWAQRNDFSPREVDGKAILIVGYGRIGQRLGKLARAFGMRVIVHDPYLDPAVVTDAEHAPDLRAALAQCDVVSLHVPATEIPVLGAGEIAAMRTGAIVINTARGGLVDETALAQAIAAGRLGGAGLDVLAEEPPAPDHPLLVLENVVVTPHAAGLTAECAERMAVASVQNVLDHFAGRLDPGLVVNLKGQREVQ